MMRTKVRRLLKGAKPADQAVQPPKPLDNGALDVHDDHLQPSEERVPTPEVISPSPSGQHPSRERGRTRMIRYEPASTHQTRSQLDLIQRAEDGDHEARLRLMPAEQVEAELGRCFRKGDPESSILAFLQEPGCGMTQADAAKEILEELADETGDVAYRSALIWRYTCLRELWKTHKDPELRSADPFLDSLDQHKLVKINIVIGTSTDAARRGRLGKIRKFWGADWLEMIPGDIQLPEGEPSVWPKGLLKQMAINCEKKIPLHEAVTGWRAAVARRNDGEFRREHRIKWQKTKCLMAKDVESLNIGRPEGRNCGGRVSRVLPQESDEDDLELLNHSRRNRRLASKPEQGSIPKQKRPNNKRQRCTEDETDAGREEGGWRLTQHGGHQVKRVKNHLIRKPVVAIIDSDDSTSPAHDAGPDEASRRVVEEASSEPEPTLPEEDSPMTCDSPAYALALRKLIALFRELEDPEVAEKKSCDCCRELTLEAVRCLENQLEPILRSLERIKTHSFRGDDASATQDHGISPHKP